MTTTHEIEGTVKQGTVLLPPDQHLPDGVRVRVVWSEPDATPNHPYERQPLDATEVRADIEWATGKRSAR